MDKFDKIITGARQPYEPSSHFTEETMERIAQKPKKRWLLTIALPAAIGGVAIIALLLLPSVIQKGVSPQSLSTRSGSATTSASTQDTTGSGSASTGTDNNSLNNDLNNIQGTIDQESTDQNAASSSVDDQSQQIVVPTS